MVRKRLDQSIEDGSSGKFPDNFIVEKAGPQRRSFPEPYDSHCSAMDRKITAYYQPSQYEVHNRLFHFG